MKKKLIGIIALMLLTTLALSSCSVVDTVVDFVKVQLAPTVKIDAEPLAAEKIIDFENGANHDLFTESDGWSNGDVFNVVWKEKNVKYENQVMKLGITEEKATAWLNDAEVEFNYTAGESRSQLYYGYGDYEVSMKPSANPGTASTFFICTGPYDVKNGVKNPHDEIDIEFLGKDTTKVQFNFFVNGKGGNEFMYDLGFDATEGFHEYGFRWTETSITWFVDNEPVYMVTTDASAPKWAKNVKIVEAIPSTAGRILANYWCGNQDAWGWMGVYNGEVNDQGTEYKWFATSAQGAPLNSPAPDDSENNGNENENDNTPKYESFELWIGEGSPYEKEMIDSKTWKVYYTNLVGNYQCVGTWMQDVMRYNDKAFVTITNHGTASVKMLVQVQGSNGVTIGELFDEIPAGESKALEIEYTATEASGVASNLILFVDSAYENDDTARTGSVTIGNLYFTKATTDGGNEPGEGGTPVDPNPDPKPETPTSGNLTLDFGEFSTTIGGNVSDGYGVNVEENNVIDVVYTNIVGDSYKNIWANVSEIAGRATTFSVKVKNYGDAPVKVRIDIESQTKTSPNTTCCNVSATQDGNGVYTDTEWGGSMFEIAAGATATLEVVYDPSKLPTNVKIMIDSSTYQDSATYAGHVEFFELNFSGEYTPEDPGEQPGGGDDPNPPAEDKNHNKLTFVTGTYTIDPNNVSTETLNVSYANIPGGTYSNICANVADFANDFNTFKVTIKNNGDAEVLVRIDLKATNVVGNTNVCNTTSNGGGSWTDLEWGGSFVKVAPGAEVEVTVSYKSNHGEGKDFGAVEELLIYFDTSTYGDTNTYSGNLTLSGYGFYVVEEGGDDSSEQPGGGEGGETTDPVPEFNGLWVEFKSDNSEYAIDTLGAESAPYVNSVKVTYSNLTPTWQNVNVWLEDKWAEHTILELKITNNGAVEANVFVKIEDASAAELKSENKAIKAGETVTYYLEFAGGAKMIYFFIDSTNMAAAGPNSGDITISEIKLGKVVAAE